MSGLPFVFLGTRADDAVADGEYDAVRRFAGLTEDSLLRVRLESESLPHFDFADISGFILGGGPFNVSDPATEKSSEQVRVEAELDELCRRVIEADFPFLGACYGIGTLGVQRGGVVDRTYAEPVGAAAITLTDEGAADPLFGVLPRDFDAFLGHKEAVSRLPDGAALLATGRDCPVQGFRLGRNVYATQFHPELDLEQLALRVEVYRHHGYFEPEEGEAIVARAQAYDITAPPLLLRRFVELHAEES